MIKLYLMKTGEEISREVFLSACGRVDPLRLQKINKCRSTEDKVRSLCCGLLLQYAVKRELGMDGDKTLSLRYEIGRYGKPYLADYPQFHFNLSHSGDYAALAFFEEEIGIDIQKKRPVKETLAKKVLSETEYAQYQEWKKHAESAAEEYFFRCWCAKESSGKLYGMGIQRELCQVCCEPDPDWNEDSMYGKIISPEGFVYCREYRIGSGYWMNVCVQEEKREKAFLRALFPEKVTYLTLSHIL